MVLVDTQAGTGNAFDAFDHGTTLVVFQADMQLNFAFIGNNLETVDVTLIL